MTTDLKAPPHIEAEPRSEQPLPRSRARRFSKVLVLFAIALLAYGGYRWRERIQAEQAAAARNKSQPPPRVRIVAVPARKSDMPVYLTGQSSVGAFNTITARTRVDGQIVQVLFKQGETVKEGDPLVEIAPGPFQVQLLPA